MAFLTQNILYLLLLLILLLISGFFSGSETVLFSLSRHERLRMKKSSNRLEALAAGLLDQSRALITTLMIGNMGCNTLIFVVSSVVLAHLEDYLQVQMPVHGGWAKAIVGGLLLAPPLLVTYVADVFPKVLGRLNNQRIAPVVAVPVATLVRGLWPITRAIDVAVMQPAHRLIGTRQQAYDFSAEELRELLEMSEQQGVIDVSENELLQEVVRIGELRVRDVMTPRVDMVAHRLQDPPAKLLDLVRTSHLAKVPVYDGTIDNILGLVYAKEVFLEPRDGKLDIRKMVRPVQFVPEFVTLDRLIARFRLTRTQTAVVVDEFGGVVGVVSLEDVVEQMVGDIYEPHDTPTASTERLSPDEYRVAGDLSVTDWMEAFGATQARAEAVHTSTVAGLLAQRLQRIPKVGDQVRIGHLRMTVETMKRRRVDRVRLKLLEGAEMDGGDQVSASHTPPATQGGAP